MTGWSIIVKDSSSLPTFFIAIALIISSTVASKMNLLGRYDCGLILEDLLVSFSHTSSEGDDDDEAVDATLLASVTVMSMFEKKMTKIECSLASGFRKKLVCSGFAFFLQ
jgi:hypothetical protein